MAGNINKSHCATLASQILDYEEQVAALQPNILSSVMETFDSTWREVLTGLALPGFAIALMMLATVTDPRAPPPPAARAGRGEGEEGPPPPEGAAFGGGVFGRLFDRWPAFTGATPIITPVVPPAAGLPAAPEPATSSNLSSSMAASAPGSAADVSTLASAPPSAVAEPVNGQGHAGASQQDPAPGFVHLSARFADDGAEASSVPAHAGSVAASGAAASHAAIAAVPATDAAGAAGASGAAATGVNAGGLQGVASLLGNAAFVSTTLAASLNDVGSTALIAFHSTFYERIFHLDASEYSPALAAILPIGGILGAPSLHFGYFWS